MAIALTVVTTSAFAMGGFELFVNITSIQPQIFRPQGGEQVVISGSGFRSPVRVYIDFGTQTKEAFIISVSNTTVNAITPPIDLGIGQQREAKLILINNAGTTMETRVSPATILTFQNERLNPSIITASPQTGPIVGGTRVTIFGDGFQSPVQVFFGDSEAQIVNVTYKQVTVIAPAGRGLGSVPIRVDNVTAASTTTSPNAYRYVVPMTFTNVVPNVGSSRGGTPIAIRGTGFADPVFVAVAGVPAIVLHVSATEIAAITNPLTDAKCSGRSGEVTVINIDNGDQVSGSTFTYDVPHPFFSLPPELAVFTAGTVARVPIENASPVFGQFLLGNRTIKVIALSDKTYSIEIPNDVIAACAEPVTMTLAFTDTITGCTASIPVSIRAPKKAQCESTNGPRTKP